MTGAALPEAASAPSDAGMTIVCGDSHTATHGAFGALAFGIGTSEVEMVLATQTLLQRRPKTYEVRVDGRLGAGVSAKDIILALIARIGVGGGTGHVFEYRGEAIRALTMEQRMTICNMSIEGGARAGLIAPDDTTFEYVHGRDHAPAGADWDAAVARWRTLPTDDGAAYDRSITIDADTLEPMVTYGTNPGMADGDWLIQEGEIGDRFYVVDTGEIDVSRQGRGLRTMGAGSGVGEIALLQDVPRTASVRALGAVTGFCLDREAFVEAVTGHSASHALAMTLVDERLIADASG